MMMKVKNLYLYGDIGIYDVVSSKKVADFLFNLEDDVEQINVHINSYGGEVGEGLAIYNLLNSHKAKIVTYCDGFACSIASVIFMAGDERIMNKSSLLMIHNAWTFAGGNATELKKLAEDLEKVTEQSIKIYLERVTIAEQELKEMMDKGTWLDGDEAIDKGFATEIDDGKKNDKASQSVKDELVEIIKKGLEALENDDEENKDDKDPEKNENPDGDSSNEPPNPNVPTKKDNEDSNKNDEDEEITEKFVAFFNAFLNKK